MPPADVLVPRQNPKLMVIGDSLAQGCRSLSVSALLCEQSWSARVAAAAGWEFVTPAHPRPVLFDLEAEIRRLNLIGMPLEFLTFKGIDRRILENFAAWENQAPAEVECFDNVALAAAAVDDLYARSAISCDQQIQQTVAGDPRNILKSGNLSNLHLAVNGRYVLNPSRSANFAEYSQLKWVEARKPENLFVQIGHNHGLFKVGFEAKLEKPGDSLASITQPGTQLYFEYWEKVAQRLAALGEETQRIVVVLLPKVGGVGSLMDITTERENGYAYIYDAMLSLNPRMEGTVLADVDQQILRVNQAIREIILASAEARGTADRVMFVDAYEMIDSLDYKNYERDEMRLQLSRKRMIDNRYLDSFLPINFPGVEKRLIAGGFFSVDGMHPSGVGYAFLASKVMEKMNIAHDRSKLLNQAYEEDKLLSDYPPQLNAVIALFKLLRAGASIGHTVGQGVRSLADNASIGSAMGSLLSVFTQGK